MTKLAAIFAAASLFALAACGGTSEAPTGNEADEFAARINGGADTDTAPQPDATPAQIAPAREGAAPGAFAPGTATDPEAATCGAPKVGPYIGQQADDALRQEIVSVVGPQNEVRFILPGSSYINPDPTSPRLNVMLDNSGIIRDARCG